MHVNTYIYTCQKLRYTHVYTDRHTNRHTCIEKLTHTHRYTHTDTYMLAQTLWNIFLQNHNLLKCIETNILTMTIFNTS